jgi:peptidyl-prolyl cis-trans isomerase D
VSNGNRKQKFFVRILLGLVVGVLGIGMLLYLVPGQPGVEITGADVVAQVGDQAITMADVQDQLSRIERNGQIPQSILPLYTQQVLQQLIYRKSLEMEAARLGVKVSDAEQAERLRELVPTAYSGDTFIGMDRYAAEVQSRFQMDVPQFESLVKEELLEQKFEQLVTDGITVNDAEVKAEFRRRNDKIKIDYVIIKPDDLQAKIDPSEAEITAYFEKNKGRYTIPERRTVDYAILDTAQLQKRVQISEDEEKRFYQSHLDNYQVQDRANVSHILFKTVGKTDAEIAEIKKKAEEVLDKAKHGANFADLAKQYSEDTATKDKGGDLGWIIRGQTVPAFEAAAFSLPKGSISDLVKTQYGFHIIKVNDRQVARTQTFDEVKAGIESQLRQQKAEQTAETLSSQIADEIRRGGRIPLEEIAKKYDLVTGEAKLVQANQPLPELGNAPGVLDTIFRLRVGDLSAPLQTDKGYVILTVKDIQQAHPAKLDEVRNQVLNDYRREKSVELAKSRAEELAKRVKSGENFAAAAKALSFEAKTSDAFSRTGSVPDAGSAKLFSAAFTLPAGQSGDPIFLGTNWVVYRVLEHEPANQDDFATQEKTVRTELLQQKRQAAYDLFRSALEARLQQEGKLHINEENLKRITSSGQSS